MAQQERDHMEHKLDELQQQGSRLGPSNLSKHDQVTELEHEVLQLTSENEVSHTVMPEPIRVSMWQMYLLQSVKMMLPEQVLC